MDCESHTMTACCRSSALGGGAGAEGHCWCRNGSAVELLFLRADDTESTTKYVREDCHFDDERSFIYDTYTYLGM